MPPLRLALLERHLPGVPVRACLATALVLHLTTAWLHAGFLNADEHYQILEFAWYRLGRSPASALAWEFGERMRPALQPWLAAGTIRGLELAGAFTPFAAALVLRLVSALLGLWVTVALCARILPAITRAPFRLLAFAGSLFFWVAPCLHARFSSENWGGLWLFAGTCLLLDSLDAWPAAPRRARMLAAAAGAAGAAAFFCRFQVGFAIAGIGLWLVAIRRAPTRLVALAAAAGIVVAGLGVTIDHWFYAQWVVTPAEYFRANILEGRANVFGTSPAWVSALPFLVVLIPPFSVAFVAAVAAGCWYARRHVLVWTIVPFVLAHAAVAHKEARFMTPMVYGLVPLLAVSLDALPARIIDPILGWTQRRSGRLAVWMLVVSNVVALAVLTLTPINGKAALLRWLWEESRTAPLTVYSSEGAPYDDLLSLDYYRAPDVTVLPLASLPDAVPAEGGAGRAFVLYEGTRPPRSLSWLHACAPVGRTPPAWLVQADRLRLVPPRTVWTLCEPDATSWASLREQASRRRASRPPNPG